MYIEYWKEYKQGNHRQNLTHPGESLVNYFCGNDSEVPNMRYILTYEIPAIPGSTFESTQSCPFSNYPY